MWPAVNLITGTVPKDHLHFERKLNWNDIVLIGFVVSVRFVQLAAEVMTYEHYLRVSDAEIRIIQNVLTIKLQISAYSNQIDHG